MAGRTTTRSKTKARSKAKPNQAQLSLFGAPAPAPAPATEKKPAKSVGSDDARKAADARAAAADARAAAADARAAAADARAVAEAKAAPTAQEPPKSEAKSVRYTPQPAIAERSAAAPEAAQRFRLGPLSLTLTAGNVAAERADALVNAANPALAIAGGVDRALRRAGGRAYVMALEELQAETGGCRVGDAVISAAGALESEMVVHVVSPRWRGGTRGEPELLERALAGGLEAAGQAGARTVALPALGTGAYGVPHAVSAAITVRVLKQAAETSGLGAATVVLKGGAAFAAWLAVADDIGLEPA